MIRMNLDQLIDLPNTFDFLGLIIITIVADILFYVKYPQFRKNLKWYLPLPITEIFLPFVVLFGFWIMFTGKSPWLLQHWQIVLPLYGIFACCCLLGAIVLLGRLVKSMVADGKMEWRGLLLPFFF